MRKTVLVVDDEEDLLEIVRSHLEDSHYFVVTARDGEEGLRAAAEHKPNLIILDIAMPNMGGFEMLEMLRGIKGLAATPVLMLTAQGQSGNIFEAKRLRVAEFLIKPFTRDELIKLVSSII